MSDIKFELQQELIRALALIENMDENDKIAYLFTIFTKYLHLNEHAFIMDYSNFNNIISTAKSLFANGPSFDTIDERQVKQEDLRNYCMIQATILELLRTECVKRTIRFKK